MGGAVTIAAVAVSADGRWVAAVGADLHRKHTLLLLWNTAHLRAHGQVSPLLVRGKSHARIQSPEMLMERHCEHTATRTVGLYLSSTTKHEGVLNETQLGLTSTHIHLSLARDKQTKVN